MDLGIAGLTAIVCASSRGLGKACAAALAREGVRVVINGRDSAHLHTAEVEIRRDAKADVVSVLADVTTAEGRSALLAAAGHADILVNNAGGPPAGDFRNFSRQDWLAAIDANMLSAIELIKATIDPMIARRFGRREYHLGRRQGADLLSRPFERGAQRPHRFCCGSRSRGVPSQCHDQQPVARLLRDRPAYRHRPHARREGGPERRGAASPAGAPAKFPAVSATPRNSARSAPFFAARRRDTSPARTC